MRYRKNVFYSLLIVLVLLSTIVIVKSKMTPSEKIISISEKSSSQVKVCIDEIRQQNKRLYINGWCIREGKVSQNNKVVILKKVDNTQSYIIKPQMVTRKDVTKACNDGINYDKSGFILDIDISNIEKGKYNIYILLKSADEYEYQIISRDVDI